MTAAAGLQAEAVTVRFGGLVAIDRVDLTLAQGEILGLIGPNGAGKSTLINVLSGFQRPSSGALRIDGTQLTGAPDIDLTGAFSMRCKCPNHNMTDQVGASGGEWHQDLAYGIPDGEETLRLFGVWTESDYAGLDPETAYNLSMNATSDALKYLDSWIAEQQ